MNADQAWQSVLAQLQMEMPRASFDTWVRDTRPVGYENGALTIAVRNAYARDWLESRLASTVNRLLIGILNSNVAVSFVVSQLDENTSTTDPEPAVSSIEIIPPNPNLVILASTRATLLILMWSGLATDLPMQPARRLQKSLREPTTHFSCTEGWGWVKRTYYTPLVTPVTYTA